MDMIETFNEICNLISSKSKEELEKIYLLSVLKRTKLENKLKKIENMFKSGTVDLEELRKIVLEVEKDG